jgi:fibro-slime domain-containing protein
VTSTVTVLKLQISDSETGTDMKQKGFILVFSLFMVLGVSALAVAMVASSRMNKTGGVNYKNRLQSFYASDGLMALISQEVLEGRDSLYVKNQMGSITGKVWDYSTNFNLPAMKAWPITHPTPRSVTASTFLGSNWNLDRYLVVWKGYVYPPITGKYKFSVRADDVGGFYLSSDDLPSHLSNTPICSTLTYSYSWPSGGGAISLPQYLEAGKRYYFEFYHSENSGLDHGEVGWSGPEWFAEKPILGRNLAPYPSVGRVDSVLQIVSRKVKYTALRLGTDVLSLHTEAFKVMDSDTSYQSPLDQVLSLKGRVLTPPDTLKLKVIFYDQNYVGPGTNNEFEFLNPMFDTPNNLPVTNMVNPTIQQYDVTNADYFGLTRLAKPTPGTNIWGNCGVTRWFQPWVNNAANNRRIPRYRTRSDCADSSITNQNTYQNIVIRDSLAFIRDPSLGINTYVFSRIGGGIEPGYYPLDGRGYGNQNGPSPFRPTDPLHNYGFCTEMHTQFEMFSGMSFSFNGDDDLWVFINGSLVMDLGATHQPSSADLQIDDLGLTYGQVYPFDLFTCERHTWRSTLRIVTNLPIVRLRGKMSTSWKRNYGKL